MGNVVELKKTVSYEKFWKESGKYYDEVIFEIGPHYLFKNPELIEYFDIVPKAEDSA